MDKEKIEAGVRLILEGIGEDPHREGLLDTPDRIARMYEEIFGGLTLTAEEPLSKTFHVKDNAMVLEKDIPSMHLRSVPSTVPGSADALHTLPRFLPVC